MRFEGQELIQVLAKTTSPVKVLHYNSGPLDKITPLEAFLFASANACEGFGSTNRVRGIKPLHNVHVAQWDRRGFTPAAPNPQILTAAITERARLLKERAHLEASAAGSHTAAEWQAIVAKFGNKCLRCEMSGEHTTMTKDHITPLSEGGTNFASNLQPLCRSCNSWKGSRDVDFRTSYASA